VASYTFNGTELRDTHNAVIARVRGDEIEDAHHNTVGRLNGDEVQDAQYNILGRISGEDIQDPYGRLIATWDDVHKMIEGPAERAIAALWILFLQ
jgi:hypothetical protein